ncbi:nol10, partial [Symbiodinium sp. KB8]
MEEGAQGQGEARVYDDYKFITRDELLKLGMGHLVGSSLLRPYMHGFFIDVRLYKKVAAAVDPFAYDKWRKAKVAEKLAAKAGSRITPAASRVKVNADVAAAGTSAATTDDRFAGMFSNPDMAVDTKSAEYAAHLEASGSAGGRRGRPAWQRAHDSDDDE